MKQRTIIENDAQLQFLFGQRDRMSTAPTVDSKISGEDDGKAEFVLNPDFGQKFDLAKDSSRFAYSILNRMLTINGVEDYQYISIEGDLSSMGHFLSALMYRYLRHWGLRSIEENDDFNS